MVYEIAKDGGECVKHQTHFVEDEMTDEAKSIFPPNADISIWDVMEQCALSRDEEISLKNHTEMLGMIYVFIIHYYLGMLMKEFLRLQLYQVTLVTTLITIQVQQTNIQ